MQLLQAAVITSPTYAEAWNNLGVLQRDVGLVHVSPALGCVYIEANECAYMSKHNVRACFFTLDHGRASFLSRLSIM